MKHTKKQKVYALKSKHLAYYLNKYLTDLYSTHKFHTFPLEHFLETNDFIAYFPTIPNSVYGLQDNDKKEWLENFNTVFINVKEFKKIVNFHFNKHLKNCGINDKI